MGRQKGRSLFIVAFLSPAVLLYGGFVLWPLVQAFQLSAYRWRGLSANRRFIGWDNYQRLIADPAYWQTLTNNLLLLAGCGIVIVSTAVAAAHALRVKSRWAQVFQATYLFPQMVSLVVVAVMWQFILNPEGLLNAGMRAAGLGSMTRTWLGESQWALPAVGLAFCWYALGFYTMLFAAGIDGLPKEVSEAAELDGCSGWKRFGSVTWPMLWSIKRVAITYLAIHVMNTFALVYLMTRGGPDRRSELMLTYLYEQAFTNSQFGYAATVAIGNLVAIMTISLGILWVYRRNPMEARS
jgi:N-acetylglucosamine transport system permease protein